MLSIAAGKCKSKLKVEGDINMNFFGQALPWANRMLVERRQIQEAHDVELRQRQRQAVERAHKGRERFLELERSHRENSNPNKQKSSPAWI